MNLCERHNRILYNNVSGSNRVKAEEILTQKIETQLGASRLKEAAAELEGRCVICWMGSDKLLLETIREIVSYESGG